VNNSRQFSAHSFLFVFLALLLIIVLLAGAAFFLTREQRSLPAGQVAGEDSIYFSPTVDGLEDEPLADSNPIPAELASSPEGITVSPVSPAPSGLITNGDRTEFKIALTFDVCQREGDLAGFDTEIIRVLNETQTPATFFLGGQWIRDHPQETQQLASNPLFELGNHSWSHLDFSAITRDEMNSEVLLAQQEMNKLGYQTNLFRLPYGTYTDEALQIIAENGLYVIQWDVVSGDPDPNIDAERMTNGVLQQVQPGSIIIMHANERGWHTAEALPGIIQSLRQQGYEIVTIPDLLRIPSAR
jgi:peptidoglycan/xylan/chitin deacetylase (PgdA/CDA1 family)